MNVAVVSTYISLEREEGLAEVDREDFGVDLLVE